MVKKVNKSNFSSMKEQIALSRFSILLRIWDKSNFVLSILIEKIVSKGIDLLSNLENKSIFEKFF